VALIAAVKTSLLTSFNGIGRLQGEGWVVLVECVYDPTASALEVRSARASGMLNMAETTLCLDMRRLMGAWSDGSLVLWFTANSSMALMHAGEMKHRSTSDIHLSPCLKVQALWKAVPSMERLFTSKRGLRAPATILALLFIVLIGSAEGK